MRVFITGIAGFLGSNLAHELINQGHTVFGIDNFVGGEERNVPNKAIAWNRDCRNLEEMSIALRDSRPDVIVHTACYPHEGLSMFSPHEITDSVTRGTFGVLSPAIDLKNKGVIPLKRFINMSSMARYGLPKEANKDSYALPFTESMTPNPQDPYGEHKLAAERSVSHLCNTHELEWVNLIPHNIYGPRQKYTDPYRNVISIMIYRAIMGMPLVIYGDGKQTRCFSHVDDVLPAIINCLDSPHVNGQTINIGPDRGAITINELAEIVSRRHYQRGNECPEWKHLPDRPREVKHANCSADKARSFLGYEAHKDIVRCVSELYDWIKNDIEDHTIKPTWDYTSHALEIDSDLTPTSWLGKMDE